jgi:hypothetical protein
MQVLRVVAGRRGAEHRGKPGLAPVETDQGR